MKIFAAGVMFVMSMCFAIGVALLVGVMLFA